MSGINRPSFKYADKNMIVTNYKYRLKNRTTLEDKFHKNLETQEHKWKQVLTGLLKVTLFMAERGLAFRGSSDRIGDRSNGNFLGIVELCSQFDPLLALFVDKVSHRT